MTREQFLSNVTDWNNHLPLLWLALEETKEGAVIEFGCGDGSTRQLHDYCKANNRLLFSFDTSEEWLSKYRWMESDTHRFFRIINNWETVKDICPNPSVILIDHAPGERRIVDVKRFSDMNGIQVLHDTQPQPTAADYGYERIWHLFKYRVHLDAGMNMEMPAEGRHNRTWASAVSNTHDVTKWRGTNFNIENYIIR